MIEIELAPCLFCGSEIVAVGLLASPTVPSKPYKACCGSCGASGPEMSTAEQASIAWNNRGEYFRSQWPSRRCWHPPLAAAIRALSPESKDKGNG